MFDLLKKVCGDECIVDSEKTMLWCDGGTALKKAIASLEKLDGHRECDVHLKKNVLKRFHKLQTYFYALSDAMTEHDFNHPERALKEKNVKAWEYLFQQHDCNRWSKFKISQQFASAFGTSTTNDVELMNKLAKDLDLRCGKFHVAIYYCVMLRYISSHLAIVLNLCVLAERISDVFTGLLDLTIKLVSDLREKVQIDWDKGNNIERSILSKCKTEYHKGKKYTVEESGRLGVYYVTKASLASAKDVRNHSWTVDTTEKRYKCRCGLYSVHKYPCRHMFAAAEKVSSTFYNFVLL